MKETGVIMSGNHPKLILDGIKTMTRRVVKLKEYSREIWNECIPHNSGRDGFLGEPYLKIPYDPIVDNAGNRIICPYGQVGDRLWVRETWYPAFKRTDQHNGIIFYASGSSFHSPATREHGWGKGDCKWKPSIHLHKQDARIWLEITEVRVERLQEISWVDIKREGIIIGDNPITGLTPNAARRAFFHLWDSFNAKRGFGWDLNPWVWVIGFKVVSNE